MKKSILVLIASTAMVANFGAPAWSGVLKINEIIAGYSNDIMTSDAPIILSSSDENDDDDNRSSQRHYSDDDNGNQHSDEDDDDCDDDDCKGTNNPAPAGTMAPPNNGLFNN